MSEIPHSVTIIGGGLVAVRTAQALRSNGYRGPITLYSEEADPPYDRPPLSKDFLTGELDTDGLQLLSDKALSGLDLDIRLSARAVGIDLAARRITLADDTSVEYDRLVIATGAQARRLPGLDVAPRVHYLRTLADARALRAELATARRVTVVGTGFIGLEVASSARHLGLHVDVVAADEGPMIGILGRQLSQWLAALHTAAGITITSSVLVSAVQQTDESITLTLSDGTTRTSDLVVVGAGVSRDLHWLEAGGLAVDGGLICDVDGRTSDPNVFGVGDVVCVHDGSSHGDVQHWTAAAESARRAATALLAEEPAPAAGDGFFWTEQHGHRLQFVGTAELDADLEVLSGALDDDKFVANVRSGDSVTGVFAAGSPREFLKQRLAFQKLARTTPSTAGVSG